VPVVRKVVAVIMLMVVTTTACTTSPPPPESTTTTTLGGAGSPVEALTELFAAIENEDYQSTALLTFDDQLALLVSLEGFGVAETSSMLTDGLPPVVRENFWKSFSAGFPVFAEEQLAGVLVGSGEEFSVEGRAFATVAVALRQSQGSGDWIARRDTQGRWRLDLFATFGPSFATPLRTWLADLGSDAEADAVRAALAEQRSSLLAALQREPFGPIGPETMTEVDNLLFEADL
jgi:hypothetical protein